MTNTHAHSPQTFEKKIYSDSVNISINKQTQAINTIKIGVIGYGYWGPNLVRSFADLPGAEVIAVSDFQVDRLAKVQSRYPAIKLTTNSQDISRLFPTG
jgi:predicted homoserine dehydrogenase-like protein